MTAYGHEIQAAFDYCTTCHQFFLTDKDPLVLYSFGRCSIGLTCLKLLLVCGLGRETQVGKVSILFRIQMTVPPISEDILKERKFIRQNFPLASAYKCVQWRISHSGMIHFEVLRAEFDGMKQVPCSKGYLQSILLFLDTNTLVITTVQPSRQSFKFALHETNKRVHLEKRESVLHSVPQVKVVEYVLVPPNE